MHLCTSQTLIIIIIILFLSIDPLWSINKQWVEIIMVANIYKKLLSKMRFKFFLCIKKQDKTLLEVPKI